MGCAAVLALPHLDSGCSYSIYIYRGVSTRRVPKMDTSAEMGSRNGYNRKGGF